MYRLSSPSGSVTAVVDLCDDSQHLAIEREGRPVVHPSPIGLDAPLHGAGEVVDVTQDERHVAESFETPYGKRREHTYEAEATTFASTFADGTEAELDVYVSDDGVAYRRRVPEIGSVLLRAERGGFELPTRATGWLTPYAVNHEATVRRVPLSMADGEFCTPGLFEIRDDDWVLLAEAGVDANYHAARLHSQPEDPAVSFVHPGPEPGDRPVRVTGTFETPWRVAIVGDLGTIVESDLVPALSDGPAIGDTDWIEPGRVAWSWWSESASPTDVDRQREYVTYAAERGWEYVLVDEGWDEAWIPDLVEDAAERDVGVFLWAHWTDLHGADERRELLDRWCEWGIDGVKIDFMDSDEQGMLQFYEAVLADAAERELLVNFHGSTVPLGLRRKWPNVMTYEGVQGAEHLKWATLTPEHNVALPYTRNVVGPMDYTPVTFSADSRHTTAGHELALSVVFESGLQHFADNIDEYAARPHAEWFLERVPAAWDETRFLRGRPGSEATLARRRGQAWFVGCIVAGVGRTIDLAATFLDDAREGVLLRDGENGSLERTTAHLGPETPLSVDVPANGGFVLSL
ncbi:glycoside hydrolase family 97 protein [Halorhabdus amylolytica]|uniref:glycoside hydrolase family 97 protein n=1 Tax=Halorhabdus amylolytica TaxID=2559573 RepID=UPI0010A9AFA9|nr:glycoside hydrolase family 97 protein [Halorhabdus amylolytica]